MDGTNDELQSEKPEVSTLDENEKSLNKLETDRATFHFVADWLSETKLLYVEKRNGFYLLNTFDFGTGESTTLYEDSSIIIDVLVHPSKKTILLHTSDNSTSADIKLIGLDGIVQHEFSIDSSELEIEWNDIDPALILFTSFHQDWSFDIFLFDGNNEQFGLLPIDAPFPKWLGTNKIITQEVEGHSLDGGKLHVYDYTYESWDEWDVSGVIYIDTFKDSALIGQLDDQGNINYSIMGSNKEIRSQWTMAAVSNYSEWVFTEIDWLTENKVIMTGPEKGGLLDELDEPYQLIQVVDGQREVLRNESVAGKLRCSPMGDRCLTGYEGEKLIDIESKKETEWLIFS
ncbi:hypothetical protein FITA111629_04870 [Filibacter tadaridae]|uniref:YqgU-like 6-bladed beta-propeller domain-containing protein n=1 Tax=Filibacter tadaridae TaxID=2483811 RepID=A0A3P5XTR2_9BACL|nr:hypothetical protein [Filibacter tadaridae]VDC32430.1 hypothetical protein FILTAD_02658 [Filibacter tadaridae]